MTASKVRLKFRVSAHDGVSAGGLPEPRWTEKWGVGLFDYEEFHVTDQLLKLPFQEATPKTVCIFSIADGSLGTVATAISELTGHPATQLEHVLRTQGG